MHKLKFILGGLLAAAALLMIAASTRMRHEADASRAELVQCAVLTFLSVVVLHWLLWRYIVPARARVAKQLTAFWSRGTPGGFLYGTIFGGYVSVNMYCLELTRLPKIGITSGGVGFLVWGLLLIGLGFAERLRQVFAALAPAPAGSAAGTPAQPAHHGIAA